MKRFRQMAFITTIATYFVIFMGGLVRVSGAGLGCPDWPKCFGRWFPPTNVNQLPPGIDPSLFNLTLVWIEYINRLGGMILGILILAIALMAIKYYRKVPRILVPSLIVALLVAIQGWQGGQVVESNLRQAYVSIHMGLAFLIASLMIYITLQAYYFESPDEEKGRSYPKFIAFQVALLWVLTICQVIFGTRIRSSLEYISRNFPLLPESEWMGRMGISAYGHAILGILVAALSWMIMTKLIRESRDASSIVRQGGTGIVILAALQVIIGAVLAIVGLPELMRIFHLWVAGLLIGMELMLYSALRHYGRLS